MDSNLQKYRAFAAAVEQGSFTKAAQVLNYTQSGVSRMISDLEREWGLVLLERGKSGVRLTGDGRKLLPLVKNICGEHEKLLSRVNEMKGLKSGLIRIGSFSSAAARARARSSPCTAPTENLPSVSVPVLSNAATRTEPSMYPANVRNVAHEGSNKP